VLRLCLNELSRARRERRPTAARLTGHGWTLDSPAVVANLFDDWKLFAQADVVPVTAFLRVLRDNYVVTFKATGRALKSSMLGQGWIVR